MAFWGFGVLFFLDFGTQACKITFTGIRNGWVRNRTGHKFPKKKKHPNEEWIDSGKPEESLPESWNFNSRKLDIYICSDVIEHIHNPNDLAQFLLSLKFKAYVISTPKREARKHFLGPPVNTHHVREWTLHESKMYLESLGFRVVKSYEGIQHISTLFAIAVPDNNKKKE